MPRGHSLMGRSRAASLLALVAAIVLMLAACADDDDGEEVATEDDDPAEEEPEEEPAEEPEDDDVEEPDDEEEEPDEAEGAEEDLEPIDLHIGTFEAGISGALWAYVLEEDMPEEFGLDIEITFQNTSPALFGDFASGVYPVATGSFDVYANQAAEGVPVELVGSFAPNTMAFLTAEDVEHPTDLAGMRFAAPTATGAYTLALATWQEWYDFDLEEEAEVITVGNPGEALAQVYADTADVAFVWEPFNTMALREDDSLDDPYYQYDEWEEQMGDHLHQFAVVRRTDMDVPDEGIERLLDMLATANERMGDDPALAEEYAHDFLDSDPGLYEQGISEGRLGTDVRPLDQEMADEMRAVIEFLQDAGEIDEVPEEFWGGY